jgi:hypothetical protein
VEVAAGSRSLGENAKMHHRRTANNYMVSYSIPYTNLPTSTSKYYSVLTFTEAKAVSNSCESGGIVWFDIVLIKVLVPSFHFANWWSK